MTAVLPLLLALATHYSMQRLPAVLAALRTALKGAPTASTRPYVGFLT